MRTQRDTPEWLADKMCKKAFDAYYNVSGLYPRILEPSAGTGAIADKLIATRIYNLKHSNITCVELNADKCKVLSDKGYNTIHGDFMYLDFYQVYDLIIAAPPFNKNIDLQHIQKMYDLLSPTGTLVSLTSPYWTVNNEE